MFELPITIQTKRQSYTIRRKGDYRLVLDCLSCLEDVELNKEERILSCLIIFYEDFSCIEDVFNNADDLESLVKEMFKFFNCGEDSTSSRQVNGKLMDWEQDSQLICAAVNKVANMEVRSTDYMHWWTFMGYYMSIGESLYSTILMIREKMMNGKSLEKQEILNILAGIQKPRNRGKLKVG